MQKQVDDASPTLYRYLLDTEVAAYRDGVCHELRALYRQHAFCAIELDWDNYFNKSGTETPYLQYCHSQGCIHTRNALMSYSPERRKHIIVAAIAPAAYIDKELCNSIMHYTTKWNRDVVPWCDILGRIRCRDNVKQLTPHEDAPWFDHSFQSPTYKETIQEEFIQYRELYGG